RVLLYHGPAERGVAAARAAGGFDLVIVAHGAEAAGRSGGVRTLCAGSNGKAIAWAGLGAGASGGVVRLGPDIPENAPQRRMHAAYVRRVREEGLADQLPRMPLPPGAGYVGAAACAPCHPAAQRAWQGSRHANALEALRKTGQESDPECLPCHVVGLGTAGGYAPGARTGLADVGCESCHGPGKAHATDAKMPMRPGAMGACAGCHVPEHSPRFSRDAYWSRIRH
ncbi:MAG: multiheme c-type cytochrome, partial [Armatimonadetes bacterium]|nr:multiheme c-type cytochrome [Armatimonadota bacterium]